MIETAQEPLEVPLPSPRVKVSHQTMVGGSWMVGGRFLSRILDLLTMLALARLLRSGDFGLVAIAASIVSVVEAALELPLSQALVRLPTLKPSHYDTAFTLSLIRGSVLSLILCSISLPFARFYADSRLIPLICVLSFAPAARGLVSPRMADFARRLDFSRDFALEFGGKFAALLVSVTLALTFRTYWSIAAGTAISPISATLLSYLLAPYRPRLSLRELSSFSGFLGWITGAQVLSAVNWQSDRLLLGKLTSLSALGLFSTANDIANIPLQTVFAPILRPLLSAFALMKHDVRRLALSYQTSSTAVFTLTLPILVGESLIAGPAVRLLFGQKWSAAAPMLRWLALSLIPALFAVPFGPLVMALDRTRIFLRRNAFELCVKIPLVVIGAIKFQFFGVIFARFVSESATVFYCMLMVRRLVGVPIREQLRPLWKSVTGAIGMAVVVRLYIWHIGDISSPFSLGTAIALAVIMGAATYCGILLLLWRWTGSPQGIEAMVAEKTAALFKRVDSQRGPPVY
jgi:O-antigen/teichoic acid export membrane protein